MVSSSRFLLLSVALTTYSLPIQARTPPIVPTQGAAYTGKYRSMFVEAGYDNTVIQQRLQSILQQFFYGDPNTETVMYPAQDPTVKGLYIEDINNQDVRTEGMSYGLMDMVQLNNQTAFDMIWTWWRTYMLHTDTTDPQQGYSRWHVHTNGGQEDEGSASDGETFAVSALIYASSRWGDSTGLYNYTKEVQFIFDAMLFKESSCNSPNGCEGVTNMFGSFYNDGRPPLVAFCPDSGSNSFTDPSYHTPHFYESWAVANIANRNTGPFWNQVINASRSFLMKAAYPGTSLTSDYATYSGQPTGSGNNAYFSYDAFRTARNVAIDVAWFANPTYFDQQVNYCNTLLTFFRNQPNWPTYGNQYQLNGQNVDNSISPGLYAMNALCSLASNLTISYDFIDALYNTTLPTGQYRYYDGILYVEAWLHLSGNYKALAPVNPAP